MSFPDKPADAPTDGSVPGHPAPPYVAPQPNGIAITALVIGIVAFISGVVPVWGVLVGVAAIVVGVLALRRRQNRAFGIVGIVGGSLGLLTSVVTTIVLVVMIVTANIALREAVDSLETVPALPTPVGSSTPIETVPATSTSSTSERSTIEYWADGDGSNVGLSWSNVENGAVVIRQEPSVRSPWSQTVTVDDPSAFTNETFTLSVMGDAESTAVTCRIVVDGEVRSEFSATGSRSVATCSFTGLD